VHILAASIKYATNQSPNTYYMKKTLLFLLLLSLFAARLWAGGIMTNSNQSAAYARLLARNATLGIDAVYYNPAGLTKLDNGFHLSLSNQSIYQTKNVVNSYKWLHGTPDAKYTGNIKVPVYPCIYAVYKMDKLAFSFGFNPVGGGGGAKFDKGLPSFEVPISDLVPSLATTSGVTDYKADINFEGSSVYFGYQFGLSYEVCKAFSVYAGVRSITARNTYKGSIMNIMINPNIPGSTYSGAFVRADQFGNDRASYYTGVATQMNGAASGLDPLISGGAGSLTAAQAASMGLITASEKAQIEGGLTSIGQSTSLTLAQAQGAFRATAQQATGGAAQMSGLAKNTADASVDVVQKGNGYTPIFGANITLDKLTLAIKYELLAKIELKNETKVDGTGKFPDGVVTRADMPALLSIGAAYPISKKLNASAGFVCYFDRGADYNCKDTLGNHVDNKTVIDKNFIELAFGLEYTINDKLMVSAGYLRSQSGVSKSFQSDMTYNLSSNTFGLGGHYKITPGIGLDIGATKIFYNSNSREFNHLLATSYIPVNETYSKSAWMVSIGLDIKIDKK